jgi:hypothetical protein
MLRPFTYAPNDPGLSHQLPIPLPIPRPTLPRRMCPASGRWEEIGAEYCYGLAGDKCAAGVTDAHAEHAAAR